MINSIKHIFNKGFALLFAMIISSIILAIGIGIANISLKEINFSSSVVATNNAFFAADTGVECALFYDNVAYPVFGNPDNGGTTPNMNCSGTTLPSSLLTSIDSVGPWDFVISNIGLGGNACAIVSVSKNLDSEGIVVTKITSRGYNIGGQSVLCESSNSNRVERVLEVVY